MNRLLLLLALVASTSFAQTMKVLGFAPDSSAVAWVESLGDPWALPEGELPFRLVVRDFTTLTDTTFPLEEEPDGLTPIAKVLAKVKPGTWERARLSNVAADGTTLDVKVVVAEGGAWSGGHYSAANSSGWLVTVAKAGTTTELFTLPSADSLRAFWSPDSRRVVLLLAHDSTGMRDPGSAEVFIGTSGAAPISVAASSRAAASKAASQLAAAGFIVTGVSIAKKQREKTVIYVSKGQDALGEKLSKQFPGATVAPLDWASPFQAVVALGG